MIKSQSITAQLFKNHINITIDGEVGWDTGLFAIKETLLNNPDAKELRVYINSFGGFVNEGNAMAELISLHRGKKTAIILGMCASIATKIALACDDIYASSKSSRILVHEVTGGGRETAEEKRKNATMMDKINDELVQLYVDKTGKSSEEIRNLMKEDREMTAEEAIEWKLIDGFLNKEKFKLHYTPIDSIMSDQLKKENERLKNLNEELNSKLKKQAEKDVNRLVELGRERGVIDDHNEMAFKSFAEKDIDSAEKFLTSLFEEKQDEKGNESPFYYKLKNNKKRESSPKKTFEELEVEDPELLAHYRDNEPEKFQELFEKSKYNR